MRAAVSERIGELMRVAKHRRAPRLGGGKADRELRLAAASLGARLAAESARRRRPRLDSPERSEALNLVSGGGGGGDKGHDDDDGDTHDALCFGLVGDTAYLPPQDNALAAALAAHVGCSRLRAVVLRRQADLDAARSLLREDAAEALSDPGALALVALDGLVGPPSRAGAACGAGCPAGCMAGQDCTAGVHFRTQATVGFAGLAESSVEPLVELSMEPMIELTLPQGLDERCLRQDFGFVGFAVNRLCFGSRTSLATARMSLPPSQLSHEGLSLRRTLWYPLLGRAMVFATIDGARRFRKVSFFNLLSACIDP